MKEVRPRLGGVVTIEGGQTLLELARYCRFEKPGDTHARDAIIQLVMDHELIAPDEVSGSEEGESEEFGGGRGGIGC